MKTIINTQETGNRNFKISTMKTFIVLTSVALFGWISQARANNHPMPPSVNDNYSLHTAIAAMASTTDAGLSVAFLEAASEENMEVENWMTNENLFSHMAVSQAETPIEIEEWMTNAENFMATTFTEESDQALEVASWMLHKENFSSFNINEDTEKALEVENWMLNENTWAK